MQTTELLCKDRLNPNICAKPLWRSNQRERAVRDLERRIAVFHEQVINPASSILEECSALLRSDGLRGESVELVKEIRQHARQIDDFAKDLPRRPSGS